MNQKGAKNMKAPANTGMRVALVVLAAMILFAGCKEEEQPTLKHGKQVFASNYPLAFFAETISGKSERVIFPEIDGDPVFWKPSVSDIAAMQQADVILINGATYEKWLDKVSLPKERVVDTSVSFQAQHISTENVMTHSHGPTGAHSHTGTAFTTWIDLTQAILQAEAAKDAMIAAGIGPREQLQKNFVNLKGQLRTLDESIESMVKGASEVPLLASHPVYQYFSRRYQLNVRSVLWEPDSLPDEAMWKELEEMKREHPAAWMIWEDEPLPESVERLKEIGIQSVVFNPCGNRPDEGDFMTVMKSNIENLRLILTNNR
jgi:zinc transport system substrate-binding protein